MAGRPAAARCGRWRSRRDLCLREHRAPDPCAPRILETRDRPRAAPRLASAATRRAEAARRQRDEPDWKRHAPGRATLRQTTGICPCGGRDARARHRRQHVDLHDGQCAGAQAASPPRTRSARMDLCDGPRRGFMARSDLASRICHVSRRCVRVLDSQRVPTAAVHDERGWNRRARAGSGCDRRSPDALGTPRDPRSDVDRERRACGCAWSGCAQPPILEHEIRRLDGHHRPGHSHRRRAPDARRRAHTGHRAGQHFGDRCLAPLSGRHDTGLAHRSYVEGPGAAGKRGHHRIGPRAGQRARRANGGGTPGDRSRSIRQGRPYERRTGHAQHLDCAVNARHGGRTPPAPGLRQRHEPADCAVDCPPPGARDADGPRRHSPAHRHADRV